ncbi:hypothetical protein [Streptacidiphilus cavernicola]|uniref:Uncharacterized protein n=1 Tax=Streptacidiphilus cavernicola TaxID=3342716 RepID=A0ABV6W053_9ACTN
MKRARAALLTVLLAAFAVKIVWWVIAPMIPYFIGGLVVVLALGYLYHRTTKW